MIPSYLHLWWHDPAPPEWVTDASASWAAMHPDWNLTLWTDQPEVQPAIDAAHLNLDDIDPNDHIRHQSNIVRWYLLQTFGGIWVDCDTEPLAPLDELLNDDRPFCAWFIRPEATVIGGPPAHPLWRDIIDTATMRGPRTTAYRRSGAHALAYCAPRHHIRFLEAGAFYDVDAVGTPIPEPQRTRRYSRHNWYTTRSQTR